jgi:hypothetical protein
MSSSGKTTDDSKAAQKARQERRLSAALRENLRRRKAQAKGRAARAAVEQPVESHDSAGIADDKRTPSQSEGQGPRS